MRLKDKKIKELCKEYMVAVAEGKEKKATRILKAIGDKKGNMQQWWRVNQCIFKANKLLNELALLASQKAHEIKMNRIKDPEIRAFLEDGPHP